MIQLTPQMRILVSVDAVDFRCGIDGLAQRCRVRLGADPFSGTVYVFRNRRRTSIKILIYDGQGFCLFQKRFSKGHFRWWPHASHSGATPLRAHELQVLLRGGNPVATQAAPDWRQLIP